jgi:AcrR family transcriptional regulator
MARPRFEKLDPEKRASILRHAAEEFAEHGFESASYNRIIERCGLSKGAIYYYFDDKEDLYVTVLTDAVQRIILDVGRVEEADSAAGYWREVEAWYGRSLHLFQKDPTAIALLRGLLKEGDRSGAMNRLRAAGRAWMESVIARGQALGAVRDDMPDGLLVQVFMALEEAIDRWLADRVDDLNAREIDRLSKTMTDLFRRVAKPERRRS